MADFFAVESGNKVVAVRHFDSERLSMQVSSSTEKEAIEAFVVGASKKLFLKMGTDEATDILSARPVREYTAGSARERERKRERSTPWCDVCERIGPSKTGNHEGEREGGREGSGACGDMEGVYSIILGVRSRETEKAESRLGRR